MCTRTPAQRCSMSTSPEHALVSRHLILSYSNKGHREGLKSTSRRVHGATSAPKAGSVLAMRRLQLGSIEHPVEEIAIDNSNNQFVDDLADLHISQPCLNGELSHHVLSNRYFSRSL